MPPPGPLGQADGGGPEGHPAPVPEHLRSRDRAGRGAAQYEAGMLRRLGVPDYFTR